MKGIVLFPIYIYIVALVAMKLLLCVEISLVNVVPSIFAQIASFANIGGTSKIPYDQIIASWPLG